MSENDTIEKKCLLITKDIVKLASGSSSQQQVEKVLSDFGYTKDDIDPAIFILTQVTEQIRSMPNKFFISMDDRERALEACQMLLDEIILLDEQSSQESINTVENTGGEEQL